MLRHGGHGHRSQCFANTDTDAGGHSDAHRYVNTDGHRYVNTDAHTNTNTNTNTNPPGPVLAQFHYSGRLRRA
jgi:hypothetical protein